MSDNEDLLADDIADQSLADYNLGNDEEDQLLADDYEAGISQIVPSDDYDGGISQNAPESMSSYSESVGASSTEYSNVEAPTEPVTYARKPIVCEVARPEPEIEVPTLVVEVPNIPTYAPYDPQHDAHMNPHVQVEPTHTLPSDVQTDDDEIGGSRERFTSERPPGAQRMPQIRDIPDSLDKVVVANSFPPRPRGWQPNYRHRYNNPYRRHNVHPGNFQRASFPPPRNYAPRPEMRLQNHPERPEMRPGQEMRPGNLEMRPGNLEMRPGPQEMGPGPPGTSPPEQIRPDFHPNHPMNQDIRPNMGPGGPNMGPGGPNIGPGGPNMGPGGPNMGPGGPNMGPGGPNIGPGPNMGPGGPNMGPGGPNMGPGGPNMGPRGPNMGPMRQERPQFMPNNPNRHMERPFRPNMPMERPRMDMRPQFRPQFPFRPNMEDPNMRPSFQPNMRPNFEPRPMYQYQRPGFRPFGPPMREVTPNMAHIPQVTIRQQMPMNTGPGPMGPMGPMGREPEVRMLPVLPPILPPGQKVLINPHFKGNLHNVEGLAMPLPAYIPTRIPKTPPLSPTMDKIGPPKDYDDAAERFIAEQRNALARAATRKFQRKSPQRHIENTRIEIENDLLGAPPQPPRVDDDLLRRQEEFINANRAQLTRRMRSPTPPPRKSPPRRSLSPRRSPERPRIRVDTNRDKPNDEESEYRRRMREQESLRERVLRAKEVRRRKNAVAHKQVERDRERAEKEKEREREREKPKPKPEEPKVEAVKPDTTRKSPEKEPEIRDRSPVREAEVNSTCENLTPPREELPKSPKSPERALTPPLPVKDKESNTQIKEKEKEKETLYSDDDLDLILDDIDDILSDDDSGRFKEKAKKADPPKPTKVDLRSKLPPKTETKAPKQRITFHDKKEKEKEDKKEKDRKREKSPPRRTLVSSSTKNEESEVKTKKSKTKEERKEEKKAKERSRQRIMFENREKSPEKSKSPPPAPAPKQKEEQKPQPFSNRRVILQRKVTTQPKVTAVKEKSVFARIEVTNDPTKPHPGIFSRAVRTAIGTEKSTRLVVKKQHEEPEIEYESSSSIDEDKLLEDEVGMIAMVSNLPHGMTDTRLKTLAGDYVQSLTLDKEDRSARITFKTTIAAESFKKKFNNKMVAASRVNVFLR